MRDSTESPLATHRLNGQRVAIIGGTGGIGLAAARAIQCAGATPIIGSRSAERIKAVEEQLLDFPKSKRILVRADDPASLRTFFTVISPLDHLVISIGNMESPPVKFLETSAAHARLHFEQTFWTSYNAAQAFAASVPWTPRSSILFVSGALSRRPVVGKSVYTAAQQALEGLARALVEELAPLRVNVLVPGLVRSPRWDVLSEIEREALFQGAASENPVGFVAGADALGGMVVEALANPYLTGSALVVDGGWSVRR
ncbi:SDR family oxidoreductase [Sphingomonas sanguinis]|uniref:SDR family oxidoreductase n=1 Tax=Sphingomonas sanguinis TaxID=33051 RepID=UPI0009EAF65E|nr:SDR family oxidoreductase [Sphingomonas sanguinis]